LSGSGRIPVDVGLLYDEQMEVVLLRFLIPLPSRFVETRAPVVGWLALAIGIVLGGPPDIPISLRIVFGGAGGLEPIVL
jgi:hypothetical protein